MGKWEDRRKWWRGNLFVTRFPQKNLIIIWMLQIEVQSTHEAAKPWELQSGQLRSHCPCVNVFVATVDLRGGNSCEMTGCCGPV